MRGPLPEQSKRRTNAPKIPTTNLPANGYKGAVPKLPPTARLCKPGRAWWRWAWRTPQAAAWCDGHVDVVARRAMLEDMLAEIENVRGLDLLDLVDGDAASIKATVRTIAALATGALGIAREMRELDDRLGLTPKAMAQLRWTIDKDSADEEQDDEPTGVVMPDRWRRAS